MASEIERLTPGVWDGAGFAENKRKERRGIGFSQNLQAWIFETEARPSDVETGYEELCVGLIPVATQEEDAAVVQSPGGVAPPLLGQVVQLRPPANSREVILTKTRSLEASARQKTALRMKLFLLVHVGEGTGSVEVRYEDLSTGETGAIVTRTVYTSSQQDS